MKDEAKKFTPAGERVLVQFHEEEKKTAGGLYLPDTARGKLTRGEVKAIGQDVKNTNVGDTVYFGRYGGVELPLDNTTDKYLVLCEKDILGYSR